MPSLNLPSLISNSSSINDKPLSCSTNESLNNSSSSSACNSKHRSSFDDEIKCNSKEIKTEPQTNVSQSNGSNNINPDDYDLIAANYHGLNHMGDERGNLNNNNNNNKIFSDTRKELLAGNIASSKKTMNDVLKLLTNKMRGSSLKDSKKNLLEQEIDFKK